MQNLMEKELEEKIIELNEILAKKKIELTSINKTIKEREEKKSNLYHDVVKRGKSINQKKKEKTSIDSNIRLLKENILELTNRKSELSSEINTLNITENDLSKKVAILKDEIRNWENKSNLYTNDIEGISKSHKSEKKYYLIGAAVFGFLMVLTIKIPIDQIQHPMSLEWLENSSIFSKEPQLSFYLLILLRISIIVISLIVIFIFLNLMRNFVSQFIKTEGRMNSVRSLLFLIDKVEAQFFGENEEVDEVSLNKKVINEQLKLLQENLPPIISPIPSSFDKNEQIPWFNFWKKKVLPNGVPEEQT